MADTKKVYRPMTFPVGTARFPKITEADTQGQYADGKFKTNVVLDDDGTATIKKWLRALAEEIYPGKKNVNLPIQTDKKDGTVSFIAKKAKMPLIVDAQRKPFPHKSVSIGGGSQIRINVTASNYEKTEKVRQPDGSTKNETMYGINLYLEAVQVIRLVAGGRVDVMSAFKDEDGFSASDIPAEAVNEADTGDETAPAAVGADAFKL